MKIVFRIQPMNRMINAFSSFSFLRAKSGSIPLFLLAFFAGIFSGFSQAAGVRCDLVLENCMDYADSTSDTLNISVPVNTTRIAREPLNVCLYQFTERKTLDIIFVIDQSGSMEGNDPDFLVPQAVDSAVKLLNELSPLSSVGNIGFSAGLCDGTFPNGPPRSEWCQGAWLDDSVNTLLYPAPLSTPGYLAGLLFLTSYGPGNYCYGCGNGTSSGTDYVTALDTAQAWLTNPAYAVNENQVIIFLTDGEPNQREEEWANLVASSDTSNFSQVYAIFVGGDNPDLQDLASQTGGQYYTLNSAGDVEQAMLDIIERVTAADPYSTQVANTTNGVLGVGTAHTSTGTSGEFSTVLDRVVPLELNANLVAMASYVNNTPTQMKYSMISVSGDSVTTTAGPFPDVSPFSLRCYDESQITFSDATSGQAITVLDFNQTSFGVDLQASDTGLAVGQQVSLSGIQTGNVILDSSLHGTTAYGQTGNATVLGQYINASWVNPFDPRDIAAGALLVDDTSAIEVVIEYFDPNTGLAITSVSDLTQGNQYIVQVTYNRSYGNPTLTVNLTSDDGDSQALVVTQVAEDVYQGLVTYGFSDVIDTQDAIISGLIDRTNPTNAVTITAEFQGQSSAFVINQLTSISYYDLAGNLITSISDLTDSLFRIVVEDNSGQDSILLLMVSDDGDTLGLWLDQTLPPNYEGIIRYKFSTTVIPNDGRIEGYLDLSSAENQTIVTSWVHGKSGNLTLVSGLVPVEKAWITDVNSDGRGDAIYIQFSTPLAVLPATISNILWPDNTVLPVNAPAAGITISFADAGRTTVVVTFNEENQFPLGATSASTANPPTLTLPNGLTPVIQDSIKPILTAAVKNPSDFKRYAISSDPNTILTQPDTLIITLSEVIAADPTYAGNAWEDLLIIVRNDSVIPVNVVGEPIVASADGRTWMVLVDNQGTDAVKKDDIIALNPNAAYLDANNNGPSDYDVVTLGRDGNRAGLNYTFREVVSGSEAYTGEASFSHSEQDKIPVINELTGLPESYIEASQVAEWVRPIGLDLGGVINYTSQRNCVVTPNAGIVEFFPEDCLSSMIILSEPSEGPYTASLQIYDHLGKFVHASTHAFGYCGEIDDPTRSTEIGLKFNDLVWNQKDTNGKIVGNGVYIWKVKVAFEGKSKEIIKKMGIVRKDPTTYNTCIAGL
ncbi:hypothetical protein ACFL5V_11400 [Fibrobacterota bacterium]